MTWPGPTPAPSPCWAEPPADAPLTVYRVSQDASSITAVGEPIAWDAVSLSVLLKSQTVVVLDSSGQTWRDGSTQWLTLLDEVSAVAGPG